MESITESLDKANSLTQHPWTPGDAKSNQTDLVTPKSPTSSPTTVRRKGSTKTAPPSMKRASSTPNVRSMAGAGGGGGGGAAEALVVSIAEKRRNRLGYHRTSVACGHCRRRKIRCLLSRENPQGKCQNCIRLKKDCNFFPIEQHPELDERPRSESKTDTTSNEAGASDSSSPSFTGSRGAEHVDDSNHRTQHLPSSMGQDVRALGPLSRSLTNPPNGGPSSASAYNTFPTYEQNPTWTTPFIRQSPQNLAVDKSQAEDLHYWRPHNTSMPVSYPQHPYSMTYPPASLASSPPSSTQQIPNFGHRDSHGWSTAPLPPLRSTSLVGPDELTAHYQNHYYHNATNQFSLSTNNSNIQHPTISRHDSTVPRPDASLSVSGMGFFPEHSSSNMNYVYPSSWTSVPPNPSPQMAGSGSERFPQDWYPDPSALAQVKEDDNTSQFHHNPPHPDNMAYQANPG